MKKQKYGLLKIGFLSLLVLASCGTSPRTTIRLGYWINNTNERLNNKFIFDAFEQAYPQYRIEPIALVYNSYGEEIPRMKIGKTLPDVIWLREEFIPIFAEQNIILPLDDFLDADDDIDLLRYVNNAIEFSSYQGKFLFSLIITSMKIKGIFSLIIIVNENIPFIFIDIIINGK
jgi:multiple sugar transport system substrate-binding protein